MDLGFANIGDEQSNDGIDLNNITPSIKLASSVRKNNYLLCLTTIDIEKTVHRC